MIICDICNKETTSSKRIPFEYRDDGLKDICLECSEEIFPELKIIEDEEKMYKKIKIKKFLKNKKK